jgi:outer membrane lipopolysaccharide assembly protein LptE/RlpB
MSRPVLAVLAVATLAVTSCGYHVGGKADLLPKGIQTIAIPSFSTFTTRYRLVDVMPQQIGREFQARTRFHIIQDPTNADAVLTGSINSVQAYPTLCDTTSGKATRIMLLVGLSITLREQTTGRTLYSRLNYSYKQYYDVAVDPHQYFDESGPALDRLSQDMARDVVSSILENF